MRKLERHKNAITEHLADNDFAQSPKWLIDMFDGYFDPCPKQPTVNGLEISWKRRNYVNPPYTEKELWINKAISEMDKGNLTDRDWETYQLTI